MRRVTTFVLGLLFLSFLSTSSMAQKKEAMPAKMKSGTMKTMTWTTNSKAAREWTQKGINHLLNVEYPQAYDYFSRAAALDPNFTEPLALMASLAVGESKKDLADRAMKSATNKPEGEKLLVSITDEKSTPETRREAWTKLHNLYPDDVMIWSGYVHSRASVDERIAAAEEFMKKYPDEAFIYNELGYAYMEKKDNDAAKKNFEKYIQLYPDGYNPYDSMGEFYLTIGDLDNAEKYYTKALEKYPFNPSSQQALEKIKAEKKKNNPEEKKQ